MLREMFDDLNPDIKLNYFMSFDFVSCIVNLIYCPYEWFVVIFTFPFLIVILVILLCFCLFYINVYIVLFDFYFSFSCFYYKV